VGYNEAETSFKAFMVDDPHSWIPIGHPDQTQAPLSVAYDGAVAYAAMPSACITTPEGNSSCMGSWGVEPARCAFFDRVLH
jgi:hypothetical protein